MAKSSAEIPEKPVIVIDDNPHKFHKPVLKPGPDTDYVESLLEAIDTTATTRIQQAHLDKTVLCTVLESDWTDVDKGEYYVSEGSAKYMAMGTPNAYRTNDRVWVLIPLGDYNNQKTIISRQVGDVGDSFVYVSPLENFVRLTEDLVPNSKKGAYSLKTNDTIHSKLIASIDMTESSAVDINGFSAFGISAKFKTDISGLEIMRGNYGLHVIIESTKEEIGGTKNGKQKIIEVPAVDSLYLQCSDMWGNPYGYDMFFEQSKMFEINDPGRTKIKKIYVYFFQCFDNHEATIKTEADRELAYQSGKFVDINRNDIDPAPLNDNLFVQDVSIYFGHTADNLNTNAYLYSQNSPNFIIKDGNPEDTNDKTLVAKFIHKADNGKNYVLNSLGDNSVYKQLLESGSLPGEFTVRWYAYNPLSTENDLRAGSGWEDITDLIPGTDQDCMQIDNYGTYVFIKKGKLNEPLGIYTDTNRTFRLNDANAGYEKFKVAFILFDSDLDGKTAPTEQDFAEANAVVQSTEYDDDSEEKKAAQKVIDDYNLFQNEVRYWSQEVVFQNGDDQTWGSLDALNSLKLEFDDGGYNGNYLIYDTATAGQAKMLNSGDAHVKRTLKGNFKSYITNETDLTRSSVIRWYIPKDTQTNHTMISEPDWMDTMFSGYKYNASLTSEDKYEQVALPIRWKSLNGKIATRANNAWKTEPAKVAWSDTDIDTADTWEKYYIFESVIAKDTEDAELKAGHISITYRIKEYWNQHFTDNTIICKIVRDGKLYEKSVNLVFGAHGTNGTEYSLIVGLGDEYEIVHVPAEGDVAAHDEFRLVAENVPAWTRTHARTNYITLHAQLYDERNKELDDVRYTWDIEEFEAGLKKTDNTDANIFYIDTISGQPVLRIKEERRDTVSPHIGINGTAWLGAYVKCTATHNGHEYSQYLLVPVRKNENYIGCVGTTKAVYTYAQTAPAVSSKDSYQMITTDYSLESPSKTLCAYDSTIGKPNTADKPKIYSDLPYLSNLKTESSNLATLILPPTYYNDMNYKMSVKMVDSNNNILWAQPVLIILDVYTNSFLNQWDGSLQIDTKKNRIATASVFAGKKNSNNSFTGVIMGELQGENPADLETGYGIYGRNNGNHTFGINTKGTAYLGDTSKAQLLFKVGPDKDDDTQWESTIQNRGYIDGSQKGMRLDFIGNTTRYGKGKNMGAPYIDIININDEDGKDDNNATRTKDNTLNRVTISGNQDHLLEVYAHGKQVLHIGNAEYYLQTGNYAEGSAGTRIDLKSGSFKAFNGGATGALLISSTGYKNNDGGYKVNNHEPNGTGWVLYSHQNFGVDTTGKIFAKAGNIAGWILNSNSLYKDNATPGASNSTLVLSSGVTSTQSIAGSGANIERTWMISAGTRFGVTTDGALYSNSGKIGGWNINGSNLYTGDLDGRSSGDVRISSGNFTRYIGPDDSAVERKNLRLAIGGNFAVDRSGTLFANGGVFSGAISGSSISGSTISGGTVIGSNVHADNLYLNGSRVYYDTTNVVGIIKGIDLSLDGNTLSATARFTYKTIYGFGMSASYDHGSTSTSPVGSSVTLPSSGGGGSGGGGDSGCILKGTPILMADYSYKNIENIKNNDMVLSYNEQTQAYEPAVVSIGATPFPSHYIYDICLENGEILSLTGSHPLLTTEGWKALNIEMAYKEHKVRTQLLHTGDEVLSINNETYRIKQIIAQPYAENYEVYNIVVPKNKTYFANNLIVHNADNDEKIIH